MAIIKECDCCNSKVTEVKRYERLSLYTAKNVNNDWDLCRYCANSQVGNIVDFERCSYTELQLAKAMSQCFNLLERKLSEGE